MRVCMKLTPLPPSLTLPYFVHLHLLFWWIWKMMVVAHAWCMFIIGVAFWSGWRRDWSDDENISQEFVKVNIVREGEFVIAIVLLSNVCYMLLLFLDNTTSKLPSFAGNNNNIYGSPASRKYNQQFCESALFDADPLSRSAVDLLRFCCKFTHWLQADALN